jgi:hypothetical protein
MDIRGGYRFSSLVKQNKKAKICFVLHIAGEKKLLFYFHFVIVKQKFKHGPLITTYIVCKDTVGRELRQASSSDCLDVTEASNHSNHHERRRSWHRTHMHFSTVRSLLSPAHV